PRPRLDRGAAGSDRRRGGRADRPHRVGRGAPGRAAGRSAGPDRLRRRPGTTTTGHRARVAPSPDPPVRQSGRADLLGADARRRRPAALPPDAGRAAAAVGSGDPAVGHAGPGPVRRLPGGAARRRLGPARDQDRAGDADLAVVIAPRRAAPAVAGRAAISRSSASSSGASRSSSIPTGPEPVGEDVAQRDPHHPAGPEADHLLLPSRADGGAPPGPRSAASATTSRTASNPAAVLPRPSIMVIGRRSRPVRDSRARRAPMRRVSSP